MNAVGALAVVFLALAALVIFRYSQWKQAEVARVQAGSQIVTTARGPVECAIKGSGPTVLVSHGGGGGYDHGLLHTRALYEQFGFRVIAISRAGYLRTPASVGRTPEEMADTYAALLDALNIRRAAILGLSAGGPSALQFALRHPDRCWGLALVSAITQSFPGVGGKQWLKRSGLADPAMWLIVSLPFLRQRYARFVARFMIPDPADRAQILADPDKLARLVRVEQVGGTNSLRRAGIEVDKAQWAVIPVYPVERITAPTLILHGQADHAVPIAHAEFVAQRVKGAEFQAIPKAGHALLLTHPEASERLAEFLQRIKAEG
jgi:pimeloyl-ACP methyl ester carboxylesterase